MWNRIVKCREFVLAESSLNENMWTKQEPMLKEVNREHLFYQNRRQKEEYQSIIHGKRSNGSRKRVYMESLDKARDSTDTVTDKMSLKLLKIGYMKKGQKPS